MLVVSEALLSLRRAGRPPEERDKLFQEALKTGAFSKSAVERVESEGYLDISNYQHQGTVDTFIRYVLEKAPVSHSPGQVAIIVDFHPKQRKVVKAEVLKTRSTSTNYYEATILSFTRTRIQIEKRPLL